MKRTAGWVSAWMLCTVALVAGHHRTMLPGA
jgi:hypothetical protein